MANVSEIWDSDQLWLKAKHFMNRALERGSLDEEGLLWRCVGLELLARAVLTAAHPALNADPGHEGIHILFACGFDVGKQPKSVPAHAVFARLQKMHPDFEAHAKICEYLTVLRNEELHTAGQPFADLGEPNWLARYYAAVIFLCHRLRRNAADFLGDELAHAEELIQEADQELKAAVHKRIAAARKAYEALSSQEQETAKQDGERRLEHLDRTQIASCPACKNSGLLSGTWLKDSRPFFDNDELLVTQTLRTTQYQCPVCGLELRTTRECVVADVPLQFTENVVTDLHEIHQDQDWPEYDNM